MRPRMTTEQWIEKAREVHGCYFDYSFVEYVNQSTRVLVLCPHHGPFWALPKTHIKDGAGCPVCAQQDREEKRRVSDEEFYARAEEVHEDRFDYGPTWRSGRYGYAVVICPEHGPFAQRMQKHLFGQGCRRCAGVVPPTTAEWVADARKVYGDRYDYSKASYTGAHEPVTIICREHGEFRQDASSHLKGHEGCSGCASLKRVELGEKRRITGEEWVSRARTAHGDRFVYEGVRRGEYGAILIVVCAEHGRFEQLAEVHIRSSGCRRCSGKYKPETEEWIERAVQTHGDRYDYSEAEYVSAHGQVKIICPEHGPFWQGARVHVMGAGCQQCGKVYVPTTEEFIARLREVHGDHYDYSKVEYRNLREFIVVGCPTHGDFEQRAQAHLLGQGCPGCNLRRLYATEEWIDRAVEKHGDRYDYSLVEYVNSQTLVTIICRRHGEFSQAPAGHVSGRGCPRCRSSHGEREIARSLDLLGVSYEQEWRDHDCQHIGILPFDFYLPEHRALIEFDGRQHRVPVKWSYRETQEDAERRLVKIQRRDRIKNEWAELNGYRLLRVSDVSAVEEEVLNFVAGLQKADENSRALSAA